MFSKNVLVTGASGFIGLNLVRQLTNNECQVTCLVRKQSKISELEKLGCHFVVGDITNDDHQLTTAAADQDFVFHLAAMTSAPNKQRQHQVNVGGLEKLLTACAGGATPPTVVLVSSVAAVGPSTLDRPRCESDPCQPVSNYGKSKLAAEIAAARFASQVPISIVRPPIVLGPGDREGLILFKTIQRLGRHIVPGYSDHRFSVIHADDLVSAMITIADQGQRITTHSELGTDDTPQGIYFASADEIPTYAELGGLIARAVGIQNLRVLRVPVFAVWALATLNSMLNFCFGRAQFFNRDKAREATAGSWSCSNVKIKHELAWTPALPLAERLEQTAQWYRQHGWLPSVSDSRVALPQQQRHVPDESF